MKHILNIIKDSNHSFSLFDKELIEALEQKITIKDGKPYVVCAIRNKEILLKPEEVVRQLYVMKLIEEYDYPKKRIALEHSIHFGREIKSADIVIFDKDRPTVEYIIVEVKKPKLQDGKNQLRSYTNATGAPIAVWTNGGQISHYNRKDPNSYKEFNFDILMANPPFAGDIKEPRIIHKYDLGYNEKGKPKPKVGRDILFIERNLNFLKPGGRMAIVLPQGRFNNTSDKYIREYISEKARILAVVGLNVNTFKPHTGTKTSVLFVQKWNDDPKVGPLCPKVNDYPIFFAVSEKSGKDNSGDYVFVKNGAGQPKLDKYGHLIIDHDLHNHNGELPDGVAEKFIEWVKGEKLSFWR